MDIPAKVRIPLCIEQGSVFNFKWEVAGINRQSKNRYFVVVNRNPKTDTFLIMLTSTTQIERKKEFARRAGISDETIVTVTSSEYSTFSAESAFNCNDVYEVEITDLIKKIEESGSMNYPKISSAVLSKLVAGINASPRVAPAIKELL